MVKEDVGGSSDQKKRKFPEAYFVDEIIHYIIFHPKTAFKDPEEIEDMAFAKVVKYLMYLSLWTFEESKRIEEQNRQAKLQQTQMKRR